MNKYLLAKWLAFDIIKSFPKTKSWNYYITLKNWKKCFFSIFIKKYWLKWKECKYTDLDVYRRIKWIESFDCLLKKYYFRKWTMRYELLSFYNK